MPRILPETDEFRLTRRSDQDTPQTRPIDMTTMTTNNGAPMKAGQREWIGLAVLALGALLYVMDLTVLHLAVQHRQRRPPPEQCAAALDHRHLRILRGWLPDHDGHAR